MLTFSFRSSRLAPSAALRPSGLSITVRERVPMISEQDIAFYRENGYLVVTGVLSAA